MCGIALSIGPEADPATFGRMLAVLTPRGEVTETRQENGLLAGVRRLRVVDREREPVRRDFDSVLIRCGDDLDRALAGGLARSDYTVLEHARDLVGAAKWNAVPVVRRLVGPRATRRTPVR